MKKAATLGLVISASLAACSPATEQESGNDSSEGNSALATGQLRDTAGEVRGSVDLIRSGKALSVNLSLAGMEPGVRAFHLHQTGACDAPDFTTAGGHLNPFGKGHGELNPDGKHLGDLPNVEIGADGSAQVTIELDGNADELAQEIFDADGTAVMLHAGPDDYISDPAGAAGPRSACAVLVKSQ